MVSRTFGAFLTVVALITATIVTSVVFAARVHTHEWSKTQFALLSDGGIRSDGWIQEQANVSLSGFFSQGNFIEFSFNPWRPAGDVAMLGVTVCDAPEQILSLGSREPVRVALNGRCEPHQVSFRALNPFVSPQERDGRPLSVQLERVRVSSKFGFPIVTASLFAKVAVLLVVLALLSAAAWGGATLGGVFAAGVTIGSTLCLAFLSNVGAEKFFPLWVFVAALFAGMAAWRVFGQNGINLPFEDGRSRGFFYLALGILPIALGATLRLYGLSFGLPWNFHPDEVPKVNAIMRMYDQNTLNPQYFLHPSLLLYSTYAVNSLLHTFGVDGSFRDTAFLAGRIVSVTAGILSIGLTWLVGRELFSSRVGWWAAMFLAVFPLHVTCSRYLKEDSLLTFVTLCCVTCAVLAVKRDKKWLLLISGLLAGATAGTKYSGILMVVVPASAPWLASRRFIPDVKWIPWAVMACVIVPLGFLATTPFAILDSAKFLKDFGAESRHMQTGHTTSIDSWSQLWMYHFWRSLVPGMSMVVAVCSVIGAGLLLRRGRIEDLFLLGLIALFYMPAEYVKAKPAPQPERYVTPCLPFLAIAMAELLRTVSQRFSVERQGMVFASLFALTVPFLRTVELTREITDDTRLQMARWMEENIPAGSTVLMDWKPYCPRFEDGKFNVVYIPRARIIPELDIKALKASGGEYLVLSSLFYARYFTQPESNPVLRQRIREVFERVPVVKQFAPKSGTYGFHNPVVTLFSLDKQDFAMLDDELTRKRKGSLELTSNEARASVRW